MKAIVKKTIFTAVPLAGLLFLTSPVFAHGDGHGEGHGYGQQGQHGRYHDKLEGLHEEFHEHPYSNREHRRFHGYLNRGHRDFHNDRYGQRWDYSDRDWRWGRRYYGDSYRDRYWNRYPSNSWWSYYGGSRPWWDR